MQSMPKVTVRVYRGRLNLGVVIRDKSQPPYELCQNTHPELPPEPKDVIPVAVDISISEHHPCPLARDPAARLNELASTISCSAGD
jgi:hypothetical protein